MLGSTSGVARMKSGVEINWRLNSSRFRRMSCWRGTSSLAELQRRSQTLPIVFAAVSDPVGAGS